MNANIRFERLNSWTNRVAFLVATSCGAGLTPLAPGTMGAVVGLPIAYLTVAWSGPLRLALWGTLLLAGIWAAKTMDQVMETEDNQSIVMDETVGLGITAWTASTHVVTLFAAFLLFRLFDVIKPFPVRTVDRWSKRKAAAGAALPGSMSAWWGGFGVMADDVLAAFQGLAVIVILQYFHVLP